MRPFRVSLAALAALSSLATPAAAATIAATTSVNVVKPVQLSKLQDLDFGTLTFSGYTGTRTISINQAGTFACATNIVCSGTPKPARFNIQGTNKMTALVTVTGGALSNGIDSIPFTPDAPSSIYTPNSGAPGVDFNVGGSLSVSSTLVGGTYTGTINVTADYP
jgi:spore coat protein U-like protein